MKKVRYNLQNKNKSTTYIYLIFRWSGERLYYCTKFVVAPEQWNDQVQRLQPKAPRALIINAMLNRMATHIEDYYLRCLLDQQEPDMEHMQNLLDKITQKPRKKKQPPGEVLPLAFFQALINERSTNPAFSENTLKTHRSFLQYLQQYESTQRKKIAWTDFTMTWFNKLADSLYKADNNRNTVDKRFNILNAWLKVASKRGHPVPAERHSIGDVEIDNVYLSREELDLLEQVQCNNHTEQVARDRFLIGCYTGLRVSDFGDLSIQSFTQLNGATFIEHSTQKSGKETKVLIPVHAKVKAIFEGFAQMPKNTLKDVLINRYIKVVAQRAGINKEVMLIKNQGGKMVEVKKQKWEFITTHTARRTFITNALLHGVPAHVIMTVTGIRKMQTLLKYNKLEKEKSALELARSDFFK